MDGQVLVAKEKHANRYYLASTVADLGRAALAILGDRMRGGCYPPVEELYDTKYAPTVDLKEEEVIALPAGSRTYALHLEQVRRRREWRAEMRSYTTWIAKAKKALQEQDGPLAWQCLKKRNDYEYEQVYLEPLL